jgi:hypothetical protein
MVYDNIVNAYCDLQNNCKFDRPLKNGWMRGIRIQGPFFTQLRKQELKKGPKIVSQRAVKFAIILQVAVPGGAPDDGLRILS